MQTIIELNGAVILAAYHDTRPGIPGLYNRAVRVVGRGPYSHVELVFAERDAVERGELVESWSASWMDGGVRCKPIAFNQSHWHFYELPWADAAQARAWFLAHEGEPYDLAGNIRFVLPFISDSRSGWFCSEAIAAALGWSEAWRYEPNHLVTICRDMRI